MALDLFTPKAPPLFGLDISSSSVKMLEIVDGGKGGFRVERYAIEPLARDAVVDGNINNLEALIDAVKRGHKRLGTRTKHVAMAVPTGAVITKKIVVSAALREAELEVQAEAESAGLKPLVMDVESFAQQTALALVVQALPGGGKDQNIAVVDVGANVMNVT